ncbi:hypothetical protein ACA910_019196 [Epithemia clementina (nom. ined.)]
MTRSQRKRSGSGNSCKEMIHQHTSFDAETTTSKSSFSSLDNEHQQQELVQLNSIRQWMQLLLAARHDGLGKSVILHEADNFFLLVTYLTRARKLDHHPGMNTLLARRRQQQQEEKEEFGKQKGNNNNHQQRMTPRFVSLQEKLLLERDLESQYTALHWAIFRADLATLLFLLRHAASEPVDRYAGSNTKDMMMMSTSSTTLSTRPMTMLEYTTTTSTSSPTMNQSKKHNSSTNTTTTSSSFQLWQTMVTARDGEGFTPSQLLASLQRSELRACRASLLLSCQARAPSAAAAASSDAASASRASSSSFDLAAAVAAADQDANSELHFLHQHIHSLPSAARREAQEDNDSETNQNDEANDSFNLSSTETEYGCEVLTFGRAHHCALGVGTDSTPTTSSSGSSATSTTTFRPLRVQAFAQSEVGRELGAVAVAAAAHHTLVLNKAGQVYAFGLGKGGRLGIGNHERHSPLPTLVSFPNHRRCHVIAIAAAENHSLAVVQDGQTYAWGSNRFGQLGISTTVSGTTSSSTANANSSSSALVPRRVDDLKDVCICAVAAGERHSVALSSTGAVYVWGDNSSGQLGVPPRYGSGGGGSKSHKHAHASSSSTHNPVQRVQHPAIQSKTAVAVAASEYATLALTLPANDGKTLPVNSIYAWGHGNHVPSKVNLPQHQHQHQHGSSGSGSRQRRRSRSHSWNEDESMRHQHRSLINPVTIACAKYHNVATTDNGLVYTWGFHSETLGNANSSPNHSGTTTSPTCWRDTTPQLVTGMLPEHGGGRAVTVSASENHTAVVTDTGALYTWGATHGPSILGHEGVRWQPNPKRVPGLYRAVAVAAAKEHFVVLSGTSFPPTPAIATTSPKFTAALPKDDDQKPPSSKRFNSVVPSLEELAALQVTKYVDMFNVWPILITAERIQNETLINFCQEFCKRNLDGVLNVGQRRVMDCYLTEQLQMHGIYAADNHEYFTRNTGETQFEQSEARDAHWHPIVQEFCKLGRTSSPGTSSDSDSWMTSCSELMQSQTGRLFLQKLRKLEQINAEYNRKTVAIARKPKLDSCGDTMISSLNLGVTAAAKSRKLASVKSIRGVSFGEDKVVTVSSKGSSRCLELTSCLMGDESKTADSVTDDESISWLEERQRALLKEIRALRKRLGQISKLMELDNATNVNEEGEDDRRGLTPEQREKIARQELLETDLGILEPALSKVNARLQELRGKQEQSSPSTGEDTEELPDTESEALTIKNVRCDLCGITCSDEASYSLHMNGRKHRNRVIQAEQEDHARKAALVVAEQHQKELLKQASAAESESTVPTRKASSNPWKATAHLSPTPQPMYKLPPPPHGVPSTLSTTTTPSKALPTCSLRDIMAAEETQRRSAQKAPGRKPAPSSATKPSTSGANATGSPLDKKNLAVSAPARAIPSPVSLSGTPNTSSRKQQSPGVSTSGAPWQLNVDALPTLDSPPWATAPVATVTNGSSPFMSQQKHPTKTSGVESTKTPACSLGDFFKVRSSTSSIDETSAIAAHTVEPKPRTPVASKQPAWSTPGNTSTSNTNLGSPVTATKFVHIQDEELAFKEKQDAACGEAQAVWFVQRRERAGSFKEIQRKDEKERDHRLFVEEQYRIEQMIQQEKEQREKEEQRAAKKKAQKKKRASQQHRRGGRNGGYSGGGTRKNSSNTNGQSNSDTWTTTETKEPQTAASANRSSSNINNLTVTTITTTTMTAVENNSPETAAAAPAASLSQRDNHAP